MKKEILRNLKRINATPKMVKMAKSNKKKMIYKSKNGYGWSDHIKNTEFDMFIRTQTRGRYLMVCLFFPDRVEAGELTPTYEVYCNPEGDEYITRYLEAGKEKSWLTAMADNLTIVTDKTDLNWYMLRTYPDIKKRVWQNPEGKKTIQQVLGTKAAGLEGLVEWQRAAKHRNTLAAEAREKAPWDADMKLVPKIMPSFEGWMKKEAADQYFIIYEYDRKGTKEGWCSYCQRYVPVTKPLHNKEGKCIRCGKSITFKVASKIKTLGTGFYEGQCIQSIKGGIVIRTFSQTQWYRDADYRNPKSCMRETERILIFDDGTVKRYLYGLYKNKEFRFILDKDYISPIYGYSELSIKLYTRNLKSLKKTALKSSTIDLWKTNLPIRSDRYLAIEKKSPVVEKLVRIGMFHLARDFIQQGKWDSGSLLDKNATELIKLLKIDKPRLTRLKEINGGLNHLKWYQYEKMVDRIWPDEMIRDFGNSGFKTGEFGFLPLPLSFVKIWNYLKRQQDITGLAIRRIKDTWNDYLNMAEKAKMDVKNDRIWKPKDLQAAHNEVVLILQQGEIEKEAVKLEKKWPKVNENLKKLKKFEYTDGKFSIVAPEGIVDIVKEGRILQHCVHTCDFYFDRIQRDETYLFFLRRAEHADIPWYTLEVEAGGNIRQKRTTGDNQNKDFEEAVEFLKKWQEFFIKKLTKAEKEAGRKADQARIQEYEKLRRDGNKVWHGKLAGKLLADVLEADFMAAAT